MIPQRLFILVGAIMAWVLGAFAEPHARGSLLGADGRSVPGSPEPVLVGSDTAAISGLEQREGSSGDDDSDSFVWVDGLATGAPGRASAALDRCIEASASLRHVLWSRGPPV
ncbi:MAG: hypothetical protein KDA29_03005 [Phycisphaerales bacterium]|nr:hypothetical protein [Phycisphaerales bacterium]